MASMAAGQRFDLVVFGATGYTGQYVAEEIARVSKAEIEGGRTPLTWAIAGRSESKLKDVLSTAKKETGLNFDDVGLILADVKDQESLNKMAAQASVVINTVGPYQKFGEPVVQACIQNKASHVDISGEPQFLEGMQLRYNEAAEEAGVHIVGACGYDSIPADMGLVHMMKNFDGELNSAQMYVTTTGGSSKTSVHTGTMESAALAIANGSEIAKIRKQLFPKKLPKPNHIKDKKGALHKNASLGLWGIPLPTDEPVVYRTQRYRHDMLGQRPLQFQQFLGFPNVFQAVFLLVGMSYFALVCYFSWTRKMLLKYPEFVTAGVFSRAGADREALKRLKFTATLVGQGWSKKLPAGSEHTSPPESSIKVQIAGPDPGYAATSLMMVASAMTILREKASCTGRGGVMTPGTAFMNTNIIDRIISQGMTVTVEKNLSKL